ncbi:hypothetical protein M422DRAFT_781867 [Sphaerobolus stellatus SS14]|uniref:Unplaced genomic scaffold SPHSTscaffold_95, whole genome shotgun sequence n=1 Tax=Sphaerobolus stellatus (strain SS14) TaxID=990650 RepID=A0A0C9V6Z9_SPHS4|nr:hypothetical protein M422DRAFT_781867 [Sphaerobolus stellatus SS14]
MKYILLSLGSALLLLWPVRSLIRRRRCSINYLPGPPPGAWLVGNLPDILCPKEQGEVELAWLQEYGTTLHIKHTFGQDMLWIADPKGLQYILNTGYNFPKAKEHIAAMDMLFGRGIIWAAGSEHARQRKMMASSFTFSALRGYIPLFQQIAQRAVNRIKNDTFSKTTSEVVDIMHWLPLITLDIICEAGFGYQLNATEKGEESTLAAVSHNLFPEVFYDRPIISLALETVAVYVPASLVNLAFRIPFRKVKRLYKYRKVTREEAQDIVNEQMKLRVDGKGDSRDIMSTLVKASTAEDPGLKLNRRQILAQITNLFFAGHDTCAITTTWAIYHLSRNPEYQALIREEIKATRAVAAKRGDDELTITDFDSMKYLLAAVKETLRLTPVVSGLAREAGKDEVIPLAIPQKTKTGEIITSVPVRKGTKIWMALMTYNRLPEVWGLETNQWHPERFLEGRTGGQKGSLEQRSVAGFRDVWGGVLGIVFHLPSRILEMQAILIEMLENFEFSPPPGNVTIMMQASVITAPMVKGGKEGEAELPVSMRVL